MNYKEVRFTITPCSEPVQDILCAYAAEAGCESFVPDDEGVTAYAQDTLLDEEMLRNLLADFPMPEVQIAFTVNEAENKDWNQEWEEHYFKPIVLGTDCVVHGSGHADYPHARFDITINPRLAFGSGQHQTTRMMMRRILQQQLDGLHVLDMGCGTCILGILALMCGASQLTAIDIDEWSVNNARENLEMNQLGEKAEVLLGDASLLTNRNFDVILANINRNILLQDMARYADCMHSGSILYLSGFYTEDVEALKACGLPLGLVFQDQLEDENWCCIKLIKA